MCATCGCSQTNRAVVIDPEAGARAAIPGHAHEHAPEHDPAWAGGRAREHKYDEDHERRYVPVQGHDPQGHDPGYLHAYTHARDAEHAHSHAHPQPEEQAHAGPHDSAHRDGIAVPASVDGRTVALEQDLLAKNRFLAELNRRWLAGRQILALNLMSSPGAGKTTLLERTIRELGRQVAIGVVEGDQATSRDAERIRAAGCRAVQINTGSGCHLDAEMLARGLDILEPPFGSVIMIENVGNLVCPALFDLGERARVVILSVTEGEDKPLKYPHMFRAADVVLLNKIDLLPYVEFDMQRCMSYAREVNPHVRVFEVSATTGEGMSTWYDWLKGQLYGTGPAGVPME